MLRPKYLEQLPSSMVELYSQVEQDILANMAARIAAFDLYGPATQWQYQRLIEMGNYRSYIIKSLSSLTGKTEREIKRLLAQAGQETLKFDDAVYRRSGLDPPPLAASPALQAVMDAGMRNTTGLFENLARTTAATATQQFERALDRAWLQVSSGAFSHQEATRMAIQGALLQRNREYYISIRTRRPSGRSRPSGRAHRHQPDGLEVAGSPGRRDGL